MTPLPSTTGPGPPPWGTGGIIIALDPACNMEVDPGGTERASEHRGVRYCLTDPERKAMFDKDPDMWSSGGMTACMGGGCSCCGGH